MQFAKYIDKAYISPDRIIRAVARMVKDSGSNQPENVQPKVFVSKDGIVTINKKNPEVRREFEHNVKVLSSK